MKLLTFPSLGVILVDSGAVLGLAVDDFLLDFPASCPKSVFAALLPPLLAADFWFCGRIVALFSFCYGKRCGDNIDTFLNFFEYVMPSSKMSLNSNKMKI